MVYNMLTMFFLFLLLQIYWFVLTCKVNNIFVIPQSKVANFFAKKYDIQFLFYQLILVKMNFFLTFAQNHKIVLHHERIYRLRQL